jgi:hypothetical protein
MLILVLVITGLCITIEMGRCKLFVCGSCNYRLNGMEWLLGCRMQDQRTLTASGVGVPRFVPRYLCYSFFFFKLYVLTFDV